MASFSQLKISSDVDIKFWLFQRFLRIFFERSEILPPIYVAWVKRVGRAYRARARATSSDAPSSHDLHRSRILHTSFFASLRLQSIDMAIMGATPLNSLLSGATFGAALTAAGVYSPTAVIEQMRFQDFHMMKAFLSASASSAYASPHPPPLYT
jgi:hypothetical protein